MPFPHSARQALAFHLAVLLFFSACSSSRSEDPVYSGTIEAIEVDIVSEVSGRIVDRPVDQGDVATQGSLVAQIDPARYRIALAETEAALESVKARLALVTSGYRSEEVRAAAREVDEAAAQVAQAENRIRRVEELLSQKITTSDDLDLARRDLDVARARLAAAKERHALLHGGFRPEEIDQARADVRRFEASRDKAKLDLEWTTVRSPLDGIVTEKLLEVGEYAKAGSPIVSVADLTNLYTWVYLSEVELPKIRTGDPVTVHVDGLPDRDFPGRVVYISPEAEFTPKNVQTVEDRVQLVFGIKVLVANPDGALKIGIPADVVLPRHGPQ